MRARDLKAPAGDGRTDDTRAIQALLDAGPPVVYLPPPRDHYLISRPLLLHTNQELVLDRFTRIRLAPRSDCLMLRNADPDQGNTGLAVRGGIWDMDNMSQSPNPFTTMDPDLLLKGAYDPERYVGVLMRFDNVRNLSLTGMTFKDPITFCVQLARAVQFTVQDITFDFNMGNPLPGNMDGIHLDGGCRFGRITDLKGTTWDDLVALNADDAIESPCFGPIEDIVVDGIRALGAHSAVRLLSNHSWVRRISISNVWGTFYQYGIGITNRWAGAPSDGLFDDITLREIHAAKAPRLPAFRKDDHPVFPMVWVERGCRVGTLAVRGLHRRETVTGVECVGVARGATVERLEASGCTWINETGSPAAFLGNEGAIGELVLQGVRAPGGSVLDNRGSIGVLTVDGRAVVPVPVDPPGGTPRWRYPG